MEMDMTYQTLITDLRRAYREARRHKAGTGSCVRCQIDIEDELDSLARSVIDGTYTMRPSRCFIVSNPVMREVIAAEFRDRIIHHYIFEYVNPHLELELIEDCYSCRTGKGTSYGVDRLEHHIRSCSQNYTRTCWALQLDISGYFMSIDRQKLYQMAMALMARIAQKRNRDGQLLGTQPRHRFVLQLLQKVILYDPLENCEVRDPDNLYAKIPRNKTLRYAPEGIGLPIGNLTSQMFSNLYMNGFDQWVKRTLKVRHYGRYVDDSYFLSDDRRWLESLVPKIGSYLESQYALRLNLQKTKLTEVRQGITFLGIHLKPYRRYVRQRTLRRLRCHADDMKKVPKARLCDPAVRQRLLSQANSMLGILGHTASYKLRRRLFGSYPLYTFACASRGIRKFMMKTNDIKRYKL